MPQTRSLSMATTSGSRRKTPRVQSSSAHQLRSKATPASPLARRKRSRVHHQPAKKTNTGAPANRTKRPAPLNLVASSVVGPRFPPSQAGSTPTESVMEAAPELIGGISTCLESVASGLHDDLGSARADPADSTMEDAANNLVDGLSDLAGEESNLPERLFDDGEASIADSDMEDAEDPVQPTADLVSKDTDFGVIRSVFVKKCPTGPALDLTAEGLAISSTQAVVEIEDSDNEHSDEGEIISDYLYRLLEDHDALDPFSDSDSDSDSSGSSIAGQTRTLPHRRSRDQGRLHQRRGNHVASTNRILQGLIEQVQSRNTGEEAGATGGEFTKLLYSEIDATCATLTLIDFVRGRVAAYRQSLLHTRRELKAEEVGDSS
jgi:hypothetical protein